MLNEGLKNIIQDAILGDDSILHQNNVSVSNTQKKLNLSQIINRCQSFYSEAAVGSVVTGFFALSYVA